VPQQVRQAPSGPLRDPPPPARAPAPPAPLPPATASSPLPAPPPTAGVPAQPVQPAPRPPAAAGAEAGSAANSVPGGAPYPSPSPSLPPHTEVEPEQPEVLVSDNPNVQPSAGSPGSSGDLAGRLRALANSPADAESLRRGLLWVASEVQACEQATRQATEQLAALANRLAAVEAREQTLAQATAGIDSLRREFLWHSGEVQARDDTFVRVRAHMEEAITDLTNFRAQAAERLTRLEGRGGQGADVGSGVAELRDELRRVTGELAAGQQSALAQVAGRTEPLEGALQELRRDVDRVAEQVAVSGQAVRDDLSQQVGAIDGRLKVVETLQNDLDGVYRELDRLSGHLSGGDGLLSEIAQRLLETEEVVAGARRELLELGDERAAMGDRTEELGRRVDATADGMNDLGRRVEEVAEGVDGVGRRIETVAEGVDGVGRRIDVVGERIDKVEERIDVVGERVSAADERVAALAALTSDVEGMYRELDRVAELSLSRDGALAQIADRTTPLEISVATLRQELDRLAVEVRVAQQGALAQVSERVDGVAERVGPLELLVDRVAELGHELSRVSEEAGSAQQAALAATTEQLGLAGRLRALETLPADIEGMYRDFERVAEGAASRDDRQGDVLERQAAVDAALEDVRAEVERLAGQNQATELDLRRRLAGLESITTDLDALYRELGRVTALATEHQDRSASFESTVTGVRESMAELRERIEDERIYTTEQVTGLWARMRAVEGVPAEIDRVAGETEKLAEAVSRALGDANETVDGVARRLEALERLPSELESVMGEIGRLAVAAREREEQVGHVRDRLEPLESTLDQIRDEVSHVRSEMASVGVEESRLTALHERLAKLERLPETVDEALSDLTRGAQELTATQQASLAGANALLQEFNDRLRALEALPADMEGLYAALYRVAASVKSLREVP
jgi:chromosome segregation ATPase